MEAFRGQFRRQAADLEDQDVAQFQFRRGNRQFTNESQIMGLLYFALYLGAGLLLLAAFTWLYIQITPFNEAEDIATGTAA